jgi:hypothetical protein
MADNIIIHPAIAAQMQAVTAAETELKQRLLALAVCEGIAVLAQIFVAITADPKDPNDPDDPVDRLAFFREVVEAAQQQKVEP